MAGAQAIGAAATAAGDRAAQRESASARPDFKFPEIEKLQTHQHPDERFPGVTGQERQNMITNLYERMAWKADRARANTAEGYLSGASLWLVEDAPAALGTWWDKPLADKVVGAVRSAVPTAPTEENIAAESERWKAVMSGKTTLRDIGREHAPAIWGLAAGGIVGKLGGHPGGGWTAGLEAPPPPPRAFSSPANQAIADYLGGLNRSVRPNLLENLTGAGRQGDAFVDGLLHEFKTLQPGATSNTIRNRVGESLKGGGQARDFVIDARATTLSRTEATRGMFQALGLRPDLIDFVSVIGKDFFIGFSQRKR